MRYHHQKHAQITIPAQEKYIDKLLSEDRTSYLNFINDIERKAGIVLSAIVIVMSIEVTFIPKLQGTEEILLWRLSENLFFNIASSKLQIKSLKFEGYL